MPRRTGQGATPCAPDEAASLAASGVGMVLPRPAIITKIFLRLKPLSDAENFPSIAIAKDAKSKRAQRALMQKYGSPKVVSPVQVLMASIYEAAGNVEWLREYLRQLSSLVLPGKVTREEISQWTVLYNDERDRLHRYVHDAVRAGIDLRQIRLYELQARAIADIVKTICRELHLEGEQREIAFRVAAQQLRSFAQNNRSLAPATMSINPLAAMSLPEPENVIDAAASGA